MRLDPPSGHILGELVERAAGARPFRDPADQETLHILEDLEARPSDLPLVATPALVQVRCVFLNRAREVVDSAALEGGGPDDRRRPAVSGLQLELQVRDEHVLVPEVDLVHDVDVADLEDPGLHRLHDIPGEGHFHDDRGVRTTRNLHLALPRAEGLDGLWLIVLDQGNELPRGPLVPFQKRGNEASDGVARTFRRNGAHAPLSAFSKNETMTLSGVPGPKTALTPARFSFGTSSSGMIPPPTTTMSPDFRFFRRRTTSGNKVMCAPLREDRPIASTSSWIAASTMSSGVWRRPVYMTSIPASRSARATTFAPRSCPSRPGFAISTRIFFPIGPPQ